MRARKLFPRLTALACAALLLLSSAPADVAARQRRRQQPRPRTRTTAPAANTPRTGATQTPTPAPPSATTPRAPQQQARRPEHDPSFEELLAADAYTVYAELRRVGTLSHMDELKSAVAALTLLGGEEARPVTDFYAFVSANAEVLGESRIVLAFMPARTGVPSGIAAFELESPAAAVAFEPKLRRILGEQVRQVKQAMGQPTATPAPTPGPQQRRQGASARVPGSDFALRRVGRWLISSDVPFKLKQLRGEESEPSLADSTRFQSVRSRFANDSLFIYVDTNVAQQAWALQIQQAAEEQAKTPAPPPDTSTGAIISDPVLGSVPVAVSADRPLPHPAPTPAEDATPDPAATPEPEPEPEPTPESAVPAEGEPGGEGVAEVTPPPEPSAEELAVRGLSGVLRNLWGGVPRIPGAVALGVGLDRGALAVRLAVENTPDGTVALIPFLPNIVSGPPVTADAASVAPADAELFVAGSLDWTHVYNSTLGAASVNPAGLMAAVGGGGDDGEGESKAERQPSADEVVTSIEKLFGFKFKEDLLPSLGNEVALSMPLDVSDFRMGPRGGAAEKEEKERDAEPGPVVFVSLNDTAKMREILPRLFVAFGFVSPGVPASAPEKREGFEIRTLGASDGISYAIINNYLAVGELKAVRYCVDAFTSRRTLAASNAYRDSTSWQAKQKLVHLFVSDAIIRRVVDDTRTRSAGSTDPSVRALLMQLETAEYAPASYEATNEGDVLLHEMRLPLSLVKSYATASVVAVKDMPVLMGETTAFYALQRIAGAELAYKNEKKKERFGTLEELIAEELLEKDFLDSLGYKVELNASSDKFEATATPKTYGKTGRRSFFIDQTEVLRAADRRGERATADDPKVEQ
jgi:hypothetical protein